MTLSEQGDGIRSPAAPAGVESARAAPRRYSVANDWLERNTWLPVVVVTLGGLLARILVALPTALTPDEAIHVSLSSAPSLMAVYKANLGIPDPSLLHFVLFPLCRVFASDFVLRLPLILAGTVAIVVGYLWLAELYDRVAGLVGALLLAFMPAVLYITTEIRAYALLLCFSVCALYFLESGIRRGSTARILLFGMFQCLALVSQYSALILLGVAGCYSLYVIVRNRTRGRALCAWIAAEVVTLALFAFLYVTQLSKMHGGSLEAGMKTGFLSDAYFNPTRETVLSFIVSRTLGAFRFLFTGSGIGAVALGLFLIAAVLLLVHGIASNSVRGRREVSFLILAPWAMAAVGGLLGLYPFTGTRHIVLLALPAVAAIAYLVREVVGRRPVLVLAAALVLVPLWNVTRFGYGAGWRILPSEAKRANIVAAADFVRRDAPGGAIIFSDLESHDAFCRYLFNRHLGVTPQPPSGFMETDRDGYRVVTLGYWSVSADSFGNEFQRMVESYGIEPGTNVYVVSCGWTPSVPRRLEAIGIRYPEVHEWGGRVAVMTIPSGTEIMSEERAEQVRRTQRSLYSLASMLAKNSAGRVMTVIWPSSYLDGTAEELTRPLTSQTVSYHLFYESIMSGSMDMSSFTPALAFWAFGTHERHPRPFAFMEEAERYVAGGCRFTLLAIGPDALAAAYLVESAEPAP
jgi:hypothetical protein